MEELSRRWLNSGIIGRTYGYSTTMLGGETIHWDFWTLFPGSFEESIFPTIMTVSHPIHTAMVALGFGLAVRYRKRLTNWILALPALLLAWSILDHAAYNGQNSLHGNTEAGSVQEELRVDVPAILEEIDKLKEWVNAKMNGEAQEHMLRRQKLLETELQNAFRRGDTVVHIG